MSTLTTNIFNQMKKERAIELFGSAYKLGEAIGISRQAINGGWGENVPKHWVNKIIKAKQDQIAAEQRKLDKVQS